MNTSNIRQPIQGGKDMLQKSLLLFSCWVTSDSLQPNGLQHARLPCPSLPPGVCSKLMSIESMMPSHHLIPCCSFLLLPSILPSIRVFSNELTLCIRWPKYWSISFSISPSNEYSGFISLKIDWFDLLAAQGTLKSLWLHASHASLISLLPKGLSRACDCNTAHRAGPSGEVATIM